MDFNTLKEEFTNTCKNLNNTIVESSAFYFIKEKYDNLGSFYKKTIHVLIFLALACLLLYYPVSHLYSSRKNIWTFKTKKKLSQSLVELSSTTQTSSSQASAFDRDPIQFINQKIITLEIPKNQIKAVKKSKAPTQKSVSLSLSATVKTVEVEMENLNLKEVVQYGYQLEQLSKNIKLTNLRILENPTQNNYFNASYVLSFFNLKSELPGKKEKKVTLKKTENDKIFDELKTKKEAILPPLPSPQFPKKENAKTPAVDSKEKEPDVPLLNIKKEDITGGGAHFENRPEEVKKRDLLPKPPFPEDIKNKSSLFEPPPPPPTLNKSPQQNINDTKKEKK